MNLATAQTLIGDGLARSPLTVAIFDSDLRIVWANSAAEAATPCLAPQDWRGRRVAEVMQEIDADAIEESLRRVLATGEPALDLVVTNSVGVWGEERYWSCIQFPVSAPGARGTRVVHVMRDVTERAVSQRRLALTEQASAHIGQTLDTTQTAQELLDVAVPRLADVAAVDLLSRVIDGEDLVRQAQHEGLRLQRVAVRWSGDSPTPADYASIGSMETNPASLHHRLMVAGRPMFLPTFGAMSTEQIMHLDVGAGRERLVTARRAGAHSLIIVPLIARDVIMGLLVMYRLRGSRPFSSADLSLASDLVSRASLSIDNARLYTRERASALVLQRALLPRDIPEVPGLDLCHRYVPAAMAAEVGGDWFDVITLSPGRYALIVGDVTGHDIHAASVMGQLRTATRTLASLDLTPAELLGRLDRVTADLTDQETFATCVYAVHDAGSGEWEMASAGHPPPVLATQGRQTGFLDLPPGLPLGIGAGHYQATRIKPPPGSTLVLYTDGLIESPGTDIGTGMASLADSLTMLSELTVDDACDALLSSLAPKPADDIAMLMVRTSPVGESWVSQPDEDRTRASQVLVSGSLVMIICSWALALGPGALALGRGSLAFGRDRWEGGQVVSVSEVRNGVSLTNLDQPLFDGAGATKRDLVEYLDAVADLIIVELRDRPLSVVRVRPGQAPFMQKNVPKYTPPWVPTVSLWAESSRREVSYALCDDRRTLLWFANQRAVEYHPTLGCVDDLGRPTYLVLDIDPPEGGGFQVAVRAAFLVRQALADAGLAGAVKTSGSKGVHVFVPIGARAGIQDVAAATRALAARAERLDPNLATTAFILQDRDGKVFLDSTRAGGATVAAAYSPRIRPGAPVSFPVAWEELDNVQPRDFTVHTAPRLITGREPWLGGLPEQELSRELIEEGHAIPIARVQAMHEGKRRARARRSTPDG